MTVIRSQRLIAAEITTNNGAATFSVPTGYVILLKSFALWNSGTSTTLAFLSVQTGTFFVDLVAQTFLGDEKLFQEVWVALNPGDRVQVFSQLAGFRFWASGAVLLGSPQFPELPAILDAPSLHAL